MKAGRELDVLIAKNVFGFKVIETDACNGKDNLWLLGEGDLRFGDQELPEYSTEISAAWDVVEKIGFRFSLIKERDGSNERRYKAFFSDGDIGFPVSYAETAPHVICLAALKTLGIEV